MAKRQLMLPVEIVKSNALCRASWSPEAIWEARLVALVAARIQKNDADFHEYEIPISEILEGQKSKGGEIHERIDKATDKTMSRILRIETEHGWIKYNIFSYCEYNGKKGVVIVRFDPGLKPHYLNLKQKFATYNLLEFMRLPSVYSQRLFEILKSWDDKPEAIIDLDNLHTMLDVPESLKKDFAAFRRRVLEKAHKDITKKTSFEYEWEAIKKGCAVVAVRFVFSRHKQQEIKTDEQQKNITKRTIYFKEAIACFEAKGKICTSCDRRKEVCALCKKVLNK